MTSATAPLTWRGRIVAVGVGFVLLAAISEFTLRAVMPNWREYHSGWFMTHVAVPGHGVTSMGVPGFDGWFAQNNGDFRARIRINGFGLRNDEPVTQADGRIWIIGDSMSFGWGVERGEMYTQILADRLAFPTYNVATPGSSVCGWQALYARMPKELRPAAVVVGLTLENRIGIFDCPAEAQMTTLPADPAGISLGQIKIFLTRHSALYNFFAVSLKRIGSVQLALTKLGLIKDPGEVLLHGQNPAKASEMIAATANEIGRLRAMAPLDRPFLVVLFPARFEIRDGTEHFRNVRIGITNALRDRKIDTLDLYQAFKAEGLETTHFAHDGHWNARGHRIAGEAVAEWFKAHPLISPPPPAGR